MSTPPKVFISYSWTTDEERFDVLQLAKALRHDGVDAMLDVWDLRPGEDELEFMNRGIRESDRVLILIDSEYTKKANALARGVGKETAIITEEIYAGVPSKKYIPAKLEDCELPDYLDGKIFIDLTHGNRKEGYDELLREIHEEPFLVKPPIGEKPKFQPELGARFNLFSMLDE